MIISITVSTSDWTKTPTLLKGQMATLSKGRNFTKDLFEIVAKNDNIVAKNGNRVEVTFDFVERIVRLVTFDNIALTLLLVWTGPLCATCPKRLNLPC